MPITDPDLKRELDRLSGLAAAQAKQIATLTARINALEKADTGPQIIRLVEAANQFGDMWASLLQNQTRTNQPVKPWRPV